MPCLGKLHHLATREERGTQDRESRVHKDLQEGAARYMKGPNTCRMQYRWPFHAKGACCRPQAPEVKKMAGTGFYFPGVYSPRRVGSQMLILRFLHFVHVPTFRGTKKLSPYIPGMCHLQDCRETHLRSCRINYRLITPTGTSELSTREGDRKSSHPADSGH